MIARGKQLPSTGKKCKKPEKPILVGDPKEESPPHLYATVQIREFLGAAVSAGSGSPVTLSAKPLYEATKGEEQEPTVWGEKQEKAFKEVKRALINTLAMGLPDMMKPFFLCT
jgi:hypothetical protein